jgi:hypothetical protein
MYDTKLKGKDESEHFCFGSFSVNRAAETLRQRLETKGDERREVFSAPLHRSTWTRKREFLDSP